MRTEGGERKQSPNVEADAIRVGDHLGFRRDAHGAGGGERQNNQIITVAAPFCGLRGRAKYLTDFSTINEAIHEFLNGQNLIVGGATGPRQDFAEKKLLKVTVARVAVGHRIDQGHLVDGPF